ncbi:PREDICTED: SPRY domain-containing SOCS box protein 3-like [Amphimedon queenslandica]|uniref:SPRY domain-containing SOCS box protein 3 n=1 Tax=Amphimedon queenslandica TaxID=400682 RepID=A0A1X7UK41_AMPQE|nr:PREDICTED: SPRY domain-containing SOCS box protein 3-like [Amphimedon queenslandica]|eukprot:XP_011404824.1 PREDICTED: SPRY domain-containing SOCS box protein 3-like [Amphimedon queenslandica]
MSSKEKEESQDFAWRWRLEERQVPAVLSEDRLSVVFHPRQSNGCLAIKGDCPLLKHMEHWFEVELSPPLHGQARMIGLGDKYTRLQSNSKDFSPLIGRDCSSWGLNYNGKTLHDGETRDYAEAPERSAPLKMGLYYDSYYGNIAFMLNEKNCGIAFQNIAVNLDLYPLICATPRGCQMKLTYSYSSVISLKALCRGSIRLCVQDEELIEKLPVPPHLKAYLLFKEYQMPKSYYHNYY